jgi:hypothetical protein
MGRVSDATHPRVRTHIGPRTRTRVSGQMGQLGPLWRTSAPLGAMRPRAYGALPPLFCILLFSLKKVTPLAPFAPKHACVFRGANVRLTRGRVASPTRPTRPLTSDLHGIRDADRPPMTHLSMEARKAAPKTTKSPQFAPYLSKYILHTVFVVFRCGPMFGNTTLSILANRILPSVFVCTGGTAVVYAE